MDRSTLQKFVDEAIIRNVIARYADIATRADYELSQLMDGRWRVRHRRGAERASFDWAGE
ncbi:hypothetical protein [Methylobacterium sp. J-076]|uniref:hypothetical protein n=1 Tax=Methylobacterium sp. J-076 TaxID=2836655 RepID=UPI001FBAF8A0|nr:hypothetical protein [Methylobacterium sp. J-076]